MPIGMSFCGLRASCAVVETASNPIYAKKITLAPLSTPDQPKWPKWPVFGGMNGCQLAAAIAGCLLTKIAASAMNTSTTETLIITIAEFRFADSFTPTTRIVVITRIASSATRLNAPVACGSVAGLIPAFWMAGRALLSICH